MKPTNSVLLLLSTLFVLLLFSTTTIFAQTYTVKDTFYFDSNSAVDALIASGSTQHPYRRVVANHTVAYLLYEDYVNAYRYNQTNILKAREYDVIFATCEVTGPRALLSVTLDGARAPILLVLYFNPSTQVRLITEDGCFNASRQSFFGVYYSSYYNQVFVYGDSILVYEVPRMTNQSSNGSQSSGSSSSSSDDSNPNEINLARPAREITLPDVRLLKECNGTFWVLVYDSTSGQFQMMYSDDYLKNFTLFGVFNGRTEFTLSDNCRTLWVSNYTHILRYQYPFLPQGSIYWTAFKSFNGTIMDFTYSTRDDTSNVAGINRNSPFLFVLWALDEYAGSGYLSAFETNLGPEMENRSIIINDSKIVTDSFDIGDQVLLVTGDFTMTPNSRVRLYPSATMIVHGTATCGGGTLEVVVPKGYILNNNITINSSLTVLGSNTTLQNVNTTLIVGRGFVAMHFTEYASQFDNIVVVDEAGSPRQCKGSYEYGQKTLAVLVDSCTDSSDGGTGVKPTGTDGESNGKWIILGVVLGVGLLVFIAIIVIAVTLLIIAMRKGWIRQSKSHDISF